MADFEFNVAKGRLAEKVDDGATIKLLVLKAAGTDADLKDLDTIADVLAEGSTTEADFTNYARKTLTNVTATVDDTNDLVEVDADDVTFTSAGGTTDNTCTDSIIYEDVDGTDANAIPLEQYDSAFTTDGNDVTLQVNANGLYRAS